jgi:murein L,D-transpeptidase YafK
MKVVLRFAMVAPLLIGLTGCFSFLGSNSSSVDNTPPSERQLSASTQALLAIKGMKVEAPIFVRIFKEESELEVWKLKDGRFQHFHTYPICAWSGELGPKVQQGDRQAPEGFYTVSRGQMNPHSLYHLAFNIGFPNAFDHANGHSGSALMVHGNCKSAGCYAMTDAYIEEIYILARDAFNAGQTKFHVQALPFRMTAWNMQRHRDNRWYPFWARLKEGYDAFESTGKPPVVKVCGKQYLVNVSFPGQASDPAPDAPCPHYAKVVPSSIDGVPQTLVASLSRGEAPPQPAAQQSQQPVVMAAASPTPTAPKPEAPQAIAAGIADMSASPVITRPAPSQLAIAQPPKAPAAPRVVARAKAPAAPVYAAAPVAAPAPVLAAVASPVQPVNYSLSSAVVAPPAPAEASRAVEPDALQKPNRSGKGGKLSAAAASEASEAQR